MSKTIEKVVDTINDVIDKVSTPSSRAGSTVERVGKMLEEGVDKEVVALQMSKTSANKQYTASDVETLGKLYQDVKTKVPITSAQTKALIDDTRKSKEVISEELIPLKVRAI